jgi:hypothetical protein
MYSFKPFTLHLGTLVHLRAQEEQAIRTLHESHL